jgi:hypothetical protein
VVAVSELVSGLDAGLVRLGFKPSMMLWYRGCWRRLERFFASRGVQEFSLDLAMTWVDQACGGFFDKERAGTLKATDVYLFRVAAMLDDFAGHCCSKRSHSGWPRQKSPKIGLRVPANQCKSRRLRGLDVGTLYA